MHNFIWPTDTERITSEFGKRWGTHHNGVDIAEGGYHPIFSVADGTVTKSYLSDSYGEVIFIKHIIDGETYESVYAHMKSGSRTVFAGDRVDQGQQIGIMGSTGDSTGQHLHLELHKGRWNYAKSNALDPLKFIKKVNKVSESVLIETGGIGRGSINEVVDFCLDRGWAFSVDYDGDGSPKATVGRLNTQWQREFENWLDDQGWYYKIIE